MFIFHISDGFRTASRTRLKAYWYDVFVNLIL